MQCNPALEAIDIFEQIASISKSASLSLSLEDKKKYAAYYTPKALSDHMISVANYKGGKLGDKGAGGGILSASAAARHLLSTSKKPCFISANEIIPEIQQYLEQAYEVISQQAKAVNKKFNYQINGDLMAMANDALAKPYGDYDNIIINPPYFKISPKDSFNQVIKAHLGFTVPNIYSAFILLSLHLLKPKGSLTALVPRSFFNGSYHKLFRRYIRKYYSIDSVTRYRTRSNLFKLDNVLQENVIIKLTKRPQVAQIKVFTCPDPESKAEHSMVLPSALLLDNDSEIFVLPADNIELDAYKSIKDMPYTLSDLGLSFTTGKVVEYRNKQSLNSENLGAMYIEAKCLDTDHDTYRKKHSSRNHGNALRINDQTSPLLVEAQNMILLKRISSNSDTQRMNCSVLRKSDCTSDKVALSNHIQYVSGAALKDTQFALRLSNYLSSKEVELAMRAINGTTQINRADMNLIRIPALSEY